MTLSVSVCIYVRYAPEAQPPWRWTSSSERPPECATVAEAFLRLCRENFVWSAPTRDIVRAHSALRYDVGMGVVKSGKTKNGSAGWAS